MRFSDALGEFLADLRAIKRSPWTITSYKSDLLKLQHELPRDTVLCITSDVLREALKRWDASGIAQMTLYRRQTAIRTFCRWGRKRRLWSENPADLLDSIPMPDSVPRPFDNDAVVRQILELELPEAQDLCRYLLIYTGIRVTSLVNLTVGAVLFDPMRIRSVGKKRITLVECHPVLVNKLTIHLASRGKTLPTDPLVSNPYGRHYCRATVERWAKSWGEMLSPPVLGVTPHRFRHEFATKLLEDTGDLRLVQEAMGHVAITSTQRYTRVKSSRLREAVSRLSWGQEGNGGHA